MRLGYVQVRPNMSGCACCVIADDTAAMLHYTLTRWSYVTVINILPTAYMRKDKFAADTEAKREFRTHAGKVERYLSLVTYLIHSIVEWGKSRVW